jgi:Nitroreductase family
MIRRTFMKTLPAVPVLAAAAAGLVQDARAAPELQPIVLPKPERDGGKSVLSSLWARRTTREIRAEPLPPQVLSNLLWAAFGVNREHGPSGKAGRTAATAFNSQEIDVYVAVPEGVYLYEAGAHRLTPVAAGDHRAKAGGGGPGDHAPVKLVYVVDLARYKKTVVQDSGGTESATIKSFTNVAAGLIGGNVYLFAASAGLAAWFHTSENPALARNLKLRSDQRVVFAQTVGYPA